jgi:hypothetical protein
MNAKKLLIFLGLVTASLRAEVEFSGFYLTSNEALFILSEKDGGESSRWLKVGESFHAYTIRSFDREHEVITIEKDGQLSHLHLRGSKVANGEMTIDGTITWWRNQASQSVHASLFLGEEAVFPMKTGVNLHITPKRQPAGSILYHTRLVTQDSEGREISDSWPDVVTLFGGEFSIRLGEFGFSFKP